MTRSRWLGVAFLVVSLALAACSGPAQVSKVVSSDHVGGLGSATPTRVVRAVPSLLTSCNDLSNWMSCLYKSGTPQAASTTLSTLAIPGTHDSGTYGIPGSSTYDTGSSDCTNYQSWQNISGAVDNWVNGLHLSSVDTWLMEKALEPLVNQLQNTVNQSVAAMAKTQTMNLTQQLNAGIRYLNLRVAWDGNQWRIVHTLFSTETLTQTLDQITDWAVAHPNEVVVVDFEHLCLGDDGATPADQASLGQAFTTADTTSNKSLCDVAYNGPDPTTTPLQTLQYDSSGHNVVIMADPDGTMASNSIPTNCYYPEGTSSGNVNIAHVWPESVSPEIEQSTDISLTNIPSLCGVNPDYASANGDLRSFAVWPGKGNPAIGSYQSSGGLIESQLLYSLGTDTMGVLCTTLRAGSLQSWESPLTSGPTTAQTVAAWGNSTNIVATDFPSAGFIQSVIDQNTVDHGVSTQPVAYVGMQDGVMWLCSTSACEKLNQAGSAVRSITYGNNAVYAGTDGGTLWKCDPTTANSCPTLDSAGTEIASITYANNAVYAGTERGTLWKCDPNAVNSCENLDQAASPIDALTYANNAVYAGTAGGTLWKCDPNAVNSCQTLDRAGHAVDAFAYGNNAVYAGTAGGTLWKCDPNAVNSCQTLDTAGSGVLSLSFGNSAVYAGTGGGTLWKCDPNAVNSCQTLDSLPGSVNGIGLGDGAVYAATGLNLFDNISVDGRFWACDPTAVNSCSMEDAEDRGAVSLYTMPAS